MVENREFLIRLAIFLASAGASAVITRSIVIHKYEEYTRQQIQEVKEFYDAVKQPIPEEGTGDEQEEGEKEGSEAQEEPREEDYKRMMKVYGRDTVPTTEYETAFVKPEGRDIFVIPMDHYYDEEGDYEKESLTYYSTDDVLVDFWGDVIRDYSDVVGDEFHDKFVESHGTMSTWVRNDKQIVDYEIDLIQGAYTEVVLGLLPEEEASYSNRDDD